MNNMNRKIIFEVGANNGRDTESFASDINSMVYAFEPSPILVKELYDKFGTRENVKIFPFAVGLNDRAWEKFNVCDFGDRGLGSLYDWHENLLNTVLSKHAEFKTSFPENKTEVYNAYLSSDGINIIGGKNGFRCDCLCIVDFICRVDIHLGCNPDSVFCFGGSIRD